MNVNESMFQLGNQRSVIREIFEYAKMRKKEIGAENVYDFSIGNPSVAPPESVKKTILNLIEHEDAVALHGYTSAQGDYSVRKAISEHLYDRHNYVVSPDFIYMTAGAAASLSVSLTGLLNRGDECVVFAPYFTEYKVFVAQAGGTLVVSEPERDTFQIDFGDFESRLSPLTKAVIVNSPNNPSGVVYTEETIVKLSDILRRKQEEYGHPIYIVTDEPYRELVYGGVFVPFIPRYYANTLVCYSYSKTLSLPGERIGYVMVSPDAEEAVSVYLAVLGAGRSLGYVCAPSLFQFVVRECVGQLSDISVYERNRKLLYEGLVSFGYHCIKPDGAFYLFVETPEPDAAAFCERAKRHELLLVPCDGFGVKGFVRIAYCVSTEQIERALPAFKVLMEEYRG